MFIRICATFLYQVQVPNFLQKAKCNPDDKNISGDVFLTLVLLEVKGVLILKQDVGCDGGEVAAVKEELEDEDEHPGAGPLLAEKCETERVLQQMFLFLFDHQHQWVVALHCDRSPVRLGLELLFVDVGGADLSEVVSVLQEGVVKQIGVLFLLILLDTTIQNLLGKLGELSDQHPHGCVQLAVRGRYGGFQGSFPVFTAQDGLGHIFVAINNSNLQSIVSVVVLYLDVGPVVQQQLGDVVVAVHGCQMQWSRVLPVSRVDLGN